MKKTILIALLLVSWAGAFAQSDTTVKPFYQRFPTITPFQILLSDSTTLYTRAQLPPNTPVLLMVFSPDCGHCQHEAAELVAHRDALKEMQVVMITLHPFGAMKDFIRNYGLDAVPNIVVGKDIHYLMPAFYQFHNLPFHALYDKKGALIKGVEGSMPIGKAVALLNGEKE